jgi:hypothetical protein
MLRGLGTSLCSLDKGKSLFVISAFYSLILLNLRPTVNSAF